VQLLRVLVVEDFVEFRRAVCTLLQAKGDFQIEQASDGPEAVLKAEELQPDLILLDIGLPKLNGLEVARRAHEIAPSAKILFVSVESDTDLVREALSLGAGYVHKPRVESDLLPAIEAVLRGEKFVSPDLQPNGRMDDPSRHEIQFCSTDSVLLGSFARFLEDAMGAGNPAIVLATEPHREGLIYGLRAKGFAVDDAMRRGTYVSLDASEMLATIMSDGVPDIVRFFEGLSRLIESAAKASQKEYPRVAICGECVDLLCAAGNTNAAILLEKTGQSLKQKFNVYILCAYRSSNFADPNDKKVLASICAEHTAVRYD